MSKDFVLDDVDIQIISHKEGIITWRVLASWFLIELLSISTTKDESKMCNC